MTTNAEHHREQLEADLAATQQDIDCLELVVDNLRTFIFKTDEDRTAFKTDLLKYSALRDRAKGLHKKISDVMAALEAKV